MSDFSQMLLFYFDDKGSKYVVLPNKITVAAVMDPIKHPITKVRTWTKNKIRVTIISSDTNSFCL